MAIIHERPLTADEYARLRGFVHDQTYPEIEWDDAVEVPTDKEIYEEATE